MQTLVVHASSDGGNGLRHGVTKKRELLKILSSGHPEFFHRLLMGQPLSCAKKKRMSLCCKNNNYSMLLLRVPRVSHSPA